MQGIRTFWNSGLIGKIVLSVAGLFVLLVVCCIGILLIPTPARNTAAGATAQPTSVIVEAQAPTVAPSATPVPTASPTTEPSATPAPLTEIPVLADRVRAAVEAVLSKGNRDVGRVTTAAADPDQKNPQIFIRWTINDNLTEGLIKASARHDAVKILKAIAELGVDYSAIVLEGTFPLVDKLGNSKESVVVHASYPKATIDNINWSNFLSDNVYVVADDVTIHPAFRE